MDNFGITMVDDIEEKESNPSDELEFPCLVLEGVSTFTELKYLVERQNRTETVLSLYVKFEDVVKKITTLDFSLEVLQLLHAISEDYKLWFYKSPFEKVVLDLNDAFTYIKFIKI